MEILRNIRWVLYPAAFIMTFLWGAYCSFPNEVVRDAVKGSLSQGLQALGPKDRGPAQIDIKDAGLWRLSGVSMTGLSMIWPKQGKNPSLSLELDSLKARVGLFSLLSGSTSLSGQAKLYKGNVDLDMQMGKSGNLDRLNLKMEQVDIGQMTLIEGLLGTQMLGKLKVDVNVDARGDLAKEGQGKFALTLQDGKLLAGNIKLPGGGIINSLAIPDLSLGKFVSTFDIAKGRIDSKEFTLTGGDLEALAKIEIKMGKSRFSSGIEGSGWFKVKREFVQANETVKMLFDLMPELRSAHEGDGKVGFLIRGTLGRPRFRLVPHSG